VTLSVKDSGIGIAGHDLPRIFERFYRAEQPQHNQQAGSGLGLSLAKWIVDLHKGSIFVESTLGEGSCFRVGLPAYLAADVDKGGVLNPQALPR
jgi:signal transduction histidine kinase